MVPSITYGVEATGFSLAQRAFARRIAFYALPGEAGGRSITCALALADDLAINIDTAGLIALSDMLWQGCERICFQVAWERGLAFFPPPLAFVRGPVCAAFLSAARVGWRPSPNPGVFICRNGRTINLDEVCPEEVRGWLRGARAWPFGRRGGRIGWSIL